jgi:hypothetical protein
MMSEGRDQVIMPFLLRFARRMTTSSADYGALHHEDATPRPNGPGTRITRVVNESTDDA